MKQNISSNKALILFILIILDMFGEVTIAAGLVLFAHHVYSVIGDRFITHSDRIAGCGADRKQPLTRSHYSPSRVFVS